MSDLQKISLRDRPEKKDSLSIDSVNSKFKKSPIIIVESNKHLIIDGSTASIDGEVFSIADMKVYQFIKYLNTNGVDAKMISTKYAMYPAILLTDFNSKIQRIEKISTSPKNIYEYGLSDIKTIVDITDSLLFDVKEIYDEDQDFEFTYTHPNIYTNAFGNSYVAFDEIYIKYLLTVQSEKAIVVSEVDIDTQLGANIINEMNI